MATNLKCPVCKKGHYDLNSTAAQRCETTAALRVRRAAARATTPDDSDLIAARLHLKHWHSYCATHQHLKRSKS